MTAHLELPVRVELETRVARGLPVGRQRGVSGLLPVVKDLVKYLGDDGRTGVRGCRVVRLGNLELGESYTGVLPEQAEQVGERHYPGEAEYEDDEEDGE